MIKRITSDEARELINKGQREFYDAMLGSYINVVGYHLDDGCAAIAEVIGEQGEDHLTIIDLGCLMSPEK